MAMSMRFEKTRDMKNLYLLKSNDGREQEIWVDSHEWACPKDIISEGSEMPHEVLKLLRKWSKEIDHIRSDFQCKATIGSAYVDFVYDHSVYKLQPGAIAATKDMFHHIADTIQQDLKHIGCPYTKYRWEFD